MCAAPVSVGAWSARLGSSSDHRDNNVGSDLQHNNNLQQGANGDYGEFLKNVIGFQKFLSFIMDPLMNEPSSGSLVH